ncbi:MAG: hypothetical protein F9K29_07965 [Hyphomicrobiaceae bacterium]|nr:MAG: hypothetical protein F9K29_07965 [Hyphomicrobiaceae bacterium]
MPDAPDLTDRMHEIVLDKTKAETIRAALEKLRTAGEAILLRSAAAGERAVLISLIANLCARLPAPADQQFLDYLDRDARHLVRNDDVAIETVSEIVLVACLLADMLQAAAQTPNRSDPH